jgi:hypothetical protein
MLRPRSAKEVLVRLSLSSFLILVGLGVLRADATLSRVPVEASKPGWRLSIEPGECGSLCRNDDRFLALLRQELGNFVTELTVVAAATASPGQTGSDAFVLIDPSGSVLARFSRDANPKRTASRIRVLLTGRFDPEIAETCGPQAVDAAGGADRNVEEVRDRWQKSL